jgi:hypothetical protein
MRLNDNHLTFESQVPKVARLTYINLYQTLKIILFKVQLLHFISCYNLETFYLINLNFERSSLI